MTASPGADWSEPDTEVFAFWLDDLARIDVHVLGRRLHETMQYWETAPGAEDLGPAELAWAARWNALPKVVVSRTLTEVAGTARLATGTWA